MSTELTRRQAIHELRKKGVRGIEYDELTRLDEASYIYNDYGTKLQWFVVNDGTKIITSSKTMAEATKIMNQELAPGSSISIDYEHWKTFGICPDCGEHYDDCVCPPEWGY